MAVLRALCLYSDAVGGVSARYAHILNISALHGGITNRLYRVSLSTIPESVLVRVYGDGSDILIDRNVDEAVFRELTTYPSGTFGVKLLATFNDGRIEEYFEGCRTLNPNDLCRIDMSTIIAHRMCEMHHLNIKTCKGKNGSIEPVLIDKLRSWHKIASSALLDSSKEEVLTSANLQSIGHEIEHVIFQKVIQTVFSPVVFCHNDLLAGNILVRGETKKDLEMVFVDFEYSNYNYRGFDIGNHFCEFSGFDYSVFEQKWPNKRQQLFFLNAYLDRERELAGVLLDEKDQRIQLESLYVEVNQYALASHLFWGLWACIQYNFSSVDFDYIKYAIGRFDAYFIAKKNLNEF